MIRLEFTAEQIEQLLYERFHHPHPRVQLKMEAVYLKAKGLRHQVICELLGICENTLRRYFREFQTGGLERLRRFEAGGSSSLLDEHTDSLCDHFVAHPPHSIAEAVRVIEELTGIRRSETQVRQFLKRCGFRRLKTGSLPAKADADEQERFKKTNSSLA